MGTDARFADVVHAAEIFVSGAGMGALELARSPGTPLPVLLGDQPEQARNVAELVQRAPDFALREVLVGDPELARSIAKAAAALMSRGTVVCGHRRRGAVGGGVPRACACHARGDERPAGPRRPSALGVLTRGGVATSAAAGTTPAHPGLRRWHGCCSCSPA